MSKKHAPPPPPAPVNPGGRGYQSGTPVTVVGKPNKPHKPAPAPPAVQRARAAAGRKGAATRKHNAALAAKHRGLALGEAVACCSAEALAASLRLTGRRVTDRDVLALYERTADSPDEGASISETLQAAAEYGLAGARPAQIQALGLNLEFGRELFKFPCILGVELPGPHAVLDAAGWWWSWGEPYDPAAFPGAVIEEAWAVRWVP